MTGVVLVVTSRRDAAATALAANDGAAVRLMTPDDLSQEGWTFRLNDPAGGTARLGGSAVPVADIAGVVTRLPAVTAHDLPHIAADDRGYVAVEMNAFLLAWLTSLPCPVVNRPTPLCLAGPPWRQEQWVLMAEQLGIPARPVVRRTNEVPGPAVAAAPDHIVTVVGREHFGTENEELAERAHALADAAGADLLSVAFDGPRRDARLVNASLWLDLGDAAIGNAVIALVRRKAGPGKVAPAL
jgi:hypothetical protein